MNRKRKRTKKKVYRLFECILTAEGEVNHAFFKRVLTCDAPQSLLAELSDGKPVCGLRPGKYKNIPPEKIEGNIVLVHKKPGHVVTLGEHIPGQGVVSAYKAMGMVSESKLDKLRANYTIDLIGSIHFRREDGRVRGPFLIGQCQRDMYGGGIIFVHDSTPEEAAETDFQLWNVPRLVSDTTTGKLVGRIGPGVLAAEDVAHINLDTLYQDKNANMVPHEFLIDPATGEPSDGVLPDGGVSFSVGRQDHVVAVLRGIATSVIEGAESGVVKGTKAEMLDVESGILAGLRSHFSPQIVDQAIAEVENTDPSAELLLLWLSPDGCTARRVPWSSLPG